MLLDKSYKKLKEIFQAHMLVKADTRILDIGCGRRGNFACLPREVYTGIDVELNKKNRDDGNYFLMDAKKLVFEDKYFDYMISTSFFHHLSDAECAAVCEQIKAKLKADGTVVIADGIYPESKLNIPGWLIRSLDRGRYVRRRNSFRNMFLKDFVIEKEYYFVDKIFAYSVLILKNKSMDNEN
ncbi:MAG: class I SAM-dependent methyltransferase [Candidatus Omnitrophota bacterium]